ncbi:uncharacterized protein LOC111619788, partial [Centruroides sculpturatus]|uniref:uncharacterized protein LOC111619788 n=1 Tax=Centruroides sculpturatus TaxID=218467 RepID=UPI000C6CAAB7
MNSNRNEINQTNQVISSYIQGTIVVITVISLLLTVSGLLGYCRHSIPKLPLWIKKENSLNSDTNVHTHSSSSCLKTRSSQQEKSESKPSLNVEEQLQKSVLINALPVCLALEWKNVEITKCNFSQIGNIQRRKISEEGQHEDFQNHDEEYNRYILLIVFQTVAMTTNLLSSIWKLIGDKECGVYVILQFLDALQIYGQGFIIFCLFHVNIKPLWKNCISRCRFKLQIYSSKSNEEEF